MEEAVGEHLGPDFLSAEQQAVRDQVLQARAARDATEERAWDVTDQLATAAEKVDAAEYFPPRGGSG